MMDGQWIGHSSSGDVQLGGDEYLNTKKKTFKQICRKCDDVTHFWFNAQSAFCLPGAWNV